MACLPSILTYRGPHSLPAVGGNICEGVDEYIRSVQENSPRYPPEQVEHREADGLEQLAGVHMQHSTVNGEGTPPAVDVTAAEDSAVVGCSLWKAADCCIHFDAENAVKTSYQTFERSLYGTFRGHEASVVVGTSWCTISPAEGLHRKYLKRQPHAERKMAAEEHTLADGIAGSGGLT